MSIQTLENGTFDSDLNKIEDDQLFLLVPLAIVTDLTAIVLNTSSVHLTWTFEKHDFHLLNGKFHTFAVTIYENFSKNF